MRTVASIGSAAGPGFHRDPEPPSPAATDHNVAGWVWAAARDRAHAPAIIDAGGDYDYAALRERAATVGAHLLRAGVEPGDRVALFLRRGPEAAAAFFATLAVGGVAVFVCDVLRPRQIEHILDHSGARVLLTSDELLTRQPRGIRTAAATVLTGSLESGGDLQPRPRRRSDLAQIVYTSGSTGQPKGVMLSHGNLRAGTLAVGGYLGIGAGDRIASLLPFSFDYGLSQLLCAVRSGAALVVERSPVPHKIVRTLRSARVSVLACVPPLWLQLLTVPDFRDNAIPTLRVMTNTGGRLPARAVRALRCAQPQARLFLMYGLTEAFRATYLPPEEVDRRPDSIGRAIPGTEILVLSERGTPCEPGEAGELVQAGPTVAQGYWNDPEATGRVFRPHPLRPAGADRVVFSGDLVRADPDGFLYFLGRRDRLIKTLGFRVSPDEVVEALHDSGDVLEATVSAEPDEALGSRISAHVVLAPGASLERLETYCRRELPRYMRPARIHVTDGLPRTGSGKYALDPAGAAP